MTTPSIAAVEPVVPLHSYPQEELSQALQALWSQTRSFNKQRVDALHQSVKVETRHLAVPKADYPAMSTFGSRNDAWQRVALELGAQAIRGATEKAGLKLTDLDLILFTTVTGLATPSIDARLINVLGLRPDIKRTPVFGLGCVAGVAGTARVADYLRAFPSHNAVLLSVELCSLTIQHDDISVSNLIAAGLFGDGAAAMVLRGGDHSTTGPHVVDSRSVFYPNTEGVMGWEFSAAGFKVVLSADVPEMVTRHIRQNVDTFLTSHGLTRKDITHWVAHTGGPKVLEAFEASLELPEGALARSWASLKKVGNLSSASVMFVLADLLSSAQAKPGDLGLMLAMGPGFCAELVLLRW